MPALNAMRIFDATMPLILKGPNAKLSGEAMRVTH
jgi:hypothetical protein